MVVERRSQLGKERRKERKQPGEFGTSSGCAKKGERSGFACCCDYYLITFAGNVKAKVGGFLEGFPGNPATLPLPRTLTPSYHPSPRNQ